MKKFWLLIVVWIVIILSGCIPNKDTTESTKKDIVVGNFTYEEYTPIDKPSIDTMENYDAIINWYVKDWKMDYTIEKEDLKYVDEDCDEYVIKWWGRHTEYSNTFKKSKIKVWNTVKLNGIYKFDDSKLQLTDEEKNTLTKRWWNIIPLNRYENYYKLDYSESSAEDETYRNYEEWTSLYEKIWWSEVEYERYPANTILITNDLLLHSFHKLFDNTLKHYEQTTARNTIKDLSNTLFDKFVDLSKNESDSDLKETYEFLAAYWSVPAILLVDGDKFRSSNGYYSWPTNDDAEIKKIIIENEWLYLNKLSSTYKITAARVIEKILDANGLETDSFLSKYSPNFIDENNIYQDYTQFTPRSHYTDNAELKTYFMAMKWLMREKFYFWDDKLSNAALIMVNNITGEETQRVSELSAKIKKLIGWDDDLTLETLTKWMKENNINNVEKIKKLTKKQRESLYDLVPQKIQSTAYERNTKIKWKISQDDARDMTAWFVFFGEKFTLDSYLFALVTAGEAEKEFKIMPKKQTALIVPDILEWNWDANQLVNLWLKEWIGELKVLEDTKHTQYSSYNGVRQEVNEKIEKEINESTVMNSVYHKWLNMIWLLVNEAEENAPYFKLDPLYRLKNLVTYMGSYTELKHDTLLYVKQTYAFAEDSWMAFDWEFGKYCDVHVDPPSLPTPKWYIEADVDIINKLIELNNEVKLDFGELWERVESQFTWFDAFLRHTKNILEQQMNNEKISDEDFEWMRLAYDELSYIVYPFWKDVSQKEMRAALIADIFTSEYKWSIDPLYEAVGRPALMLVMIDDINGKRVAIWPVFTHYEFYGSDNVVKANGIRLNDLQRQAAYDSLTWTKLDSALSTLSKELYKWLSN